MASSRSSQKPSSGTDLLARIPSMTILLQAAEKVAGLASEPRPVITAALRDTVSALRRRVQEGSAGEADCDAAPILAAAGDLVEARRVQRLVCVINATGVVLHTGLGRSVLPAAALERINNVAAGYCSLEIDLASGRRGQRGAHLERLLREITGTPAALVVNNNAAATMLVLRGLARGKEVIVSRGQLIEIGGSFRLPEVMVAGGATLREVGTTNKTHLRDYETAIGEKTAMIMHVHTSNYRVVGFSENPDIGALSELAHRHGLVMFDDLGSGALLDDKLWTAADEPTVAESLRRGADVVSFSGDKLLGGPQAGILLGRREIIDTLRRDPMARVLRIDKLTIAALEAVLELYHEPERAKREIPLLAGLTESPASLRSRAEVLADLLRAAAPGGSFTVQEDESFAGGGSLPAWPLPTAVVRWQPGKGITLDDLTRHLRLGKPSVLCRVHEAAIHLDLRTIAESEYEALVAVVSAALI